MIAYFKNSWTLSRTIEKYWELPKTIKDYEGLSRTIIDYWELSRTMKDYWGLSRTIEENQIQSNTFGDYQGLTGTRFWTNQECQCVWRTNKKYQKYLSRNPSFMPSVALALQRLKMTSRLSITSRSSPISLDHLNRVMPIKRTVCNFQAVNISWSWLFWPWLHQSQHQRLIIGLLSALFVGLNRQNRNARRCKVANSPLMQFFEKGA